MELLPGERGSRAALAGFVFATLFVVGWVLLDQSPPIGVSEAELLDYFSKPERRRSSLVAGLWVIPFAAIAFIWFMAAFRDRVVRAGGREHTLFSTVQLVAGTVFVTAIFIAGATELATIRVAIAAADGNFDIDATRGILALGSVMAQIVALRSGAVFIAVGATRAMRAGLFPRWFGLVSYAMSAALLLVATSWRPIVLVIPAWVAGCSILVLSQRQNRSLPTDA